eukprot:s1454_g23.t1
MGPKWEESENKNPKLKNKNGEQSGKKVGTRTSKWDKNGTKAGTKWEREPQSGTRIGRKWRQSGNENLKFGQEWDQSGNKVGTRTPKWDKNGTKVGTKWEQEPQSGTRMGTKWDQSGNKNLKVGQEGDQRNISAEFIASLENDGNLFIHLLHEEFESLEKTPSAPTTEERVITEANIIMKIKTLRGDLRHPWMHVSMHHHLVDAICMTAWLQSEFRLLTGKRSLSYVIVLRANWVLSPSEVESQRILSISGDPLELFAIKTWNQGVIWDYHVPIKAATAITQNQGSTIIKNLRDSAHHAGHHLFSSSSGLAADIKAGIMDVLTQHGIDVKAPVVKTSRRYRGDPNHATYIREGIASLLASHPPTRPQQPCVPSTHHEAADIMEVEPSAQDD